MNPPSSSSSTNSGSFQVQNQRNKKKLNVSQSASAASASLPSSSSSSSKQKENKKEDMDELLSQIIFVYSKKSRGHVIQDVKKNSLATILQINNLSKFNRIYATSGIQILPWKLFSFCKVNLQSLDFMEFLTRFGTIITRISFCFCPEEDEDENCVSVFQNNNNNNKTKRKVIEIEEVPSAKEFLRALTKLPNLEYLLLGPLPRHPSWTSFSLDTPPSKFEEKAEEEKEEETATMGRNKNNKKRKKNDDEEISMMDMNGNAQDGTTTFEFPSLKIFEIEKYANYSLHLGVISTILSNAPNLVRFDNFHLCLLDTFTKLEKLHLIKDLELVYPTFLTDALWQVSDYIKVLQKFVDLSKPGKTGIQLEKLLIIPDEGRGTDDMHSKYNQVFAECCGKILESCKDSLVTFSSYPIVNTSISTALPTTPSSPLKNVTTMKLFEFEVCRSGIWNEELFSNCFSRSSELLPSLLFPSLEKVELYASRYFHEYPHYYPHHRTVKFESVHTLLVHLGRSSPYDASTEYKPYFFYNLFNLFQNLAKIFTNVVHLKVRSHEKREDVVNAVCQYFDKLESLKIETAEEIKDNPRKNKKGKDDPPMNTFIFPDFISMFQNLYTDDGTGTKDKGQKGTKRPSTTKNKNEKTTPNWELIGQKKKELMDRLKDKFSTTDLDKDEVLDDSPYFEGFRKRLNCNMNLVQVARGKLEGEGGKTELVHYNELMERLESS